MLERGKVHLRHYSSSLLGKGRRNKGKPTKFHGSLEISFTSLSSSPTRCHFQFPFAIFHLGFTLSILGHFLNNNNHKSTKLDEEELGGGERMVECIRFESLCDVEGGIELQPNESNRSITIAGKCVALQRIQEVKKTIMNINGCLIGMSNFPFLSMHPVLPNGVASLPL